MRTSRTSYVLKRSISSVKLTDGRIVNLLVFSRDNYSSPDSWYYEFNGRLISPFEQRVKNWPQVEGALGILFKLTYGEQIENLIPSGTPIFSLIKKDENWESGNNYIQPIVLGEHND